MWGEFAAPLKVQNACSSWNSPSTQLVSHGNCNRVPLAFSPQAMDEWNIRLWTSKSVNSINCLNTHSIKAASLIEASLFLHAAFHRGSVKWKLVLTYHRYSLLETRDIWLLQVWCCSLYPLCLYIPFSGICTQDYHPLTFSLSQPSESPRLWRHTRVVYGTSLICLNITQDYELFHKQINKPHFLQRRDWSRTEYSGSFINALSAYQCLQSQLNQCSGYIQLKIR